MRLAPEVPFRSDLAAFDQAAPRGDPAATVAQYAGPFLDGVFVERAPRFEMSAANERECRRREFVAACETLAPRQGVRGRPAGVRAVLKERARPRPGSRQEPLHRAAQTHRFRVAVDVPDAQQELQRAVHAEHPLEAGAGLGLLEHLRHGVRGDAEGAQRQQ